MIILPKKEHVLVELPQAKSQTTDLGLILPTHAEMDRGIVQAIGDNCTAVEVGNTVFFGKFKGDEITVENKKFIIIKETNLIAVLK